MKQYKEKPIQAKPNKCKSRRNHSVVSLWLAALFLILSNVGSVHIDTVFCHTTLPCCTPEGSVSECLAAHTLTHIADYPVLFVGDSRTVGMQQALTASGYDLTNYTFLAKVGKGYSWLVERTSSLSSLTESPQIIIVNLGVNDLGNCQNYQQLYEIYMDSCWKNCPVYIVSVNPVCSPCYSVTNSQIQRFNESMQSWITAQNASASSHAFPIRYIDTYSYLQETGFTSLDGLHYSSATYLHIYDYILEHIEEPIGDGSGYTNFTYYTPSSCGNCKFHV